MIVEAVTQYVKKCVDTPFPDILKLFSLFGLNSKDPFLFQHDNDYIHKAKSVKTFFPVGC